MEPIEHLRLIKVWRYNITESRQRSSLPVKPLCLQVQIGEQISFAILIAELKGVAQLPTSLTLEHSFPRREQKLRAGKVYFAKPVKMFSKAVSPSRRPSSVTHHHLTTALSSACAGPVLQNCGNYLLFWQCFFPTPQSILDALLVSLNNILRPTSSRWS
jgi:hypothetical protein